MYISHEKALASNIGDYMNEVIYTLNKQDHHIEQQHKDYVFPS